MNNRERAISFMDGVEERSAGRVVPFSHGQAFLREELPRVYDLNFLRVTKQGASAEQLAAETERVQGPLGHRHRRVDLWDEAEARRLEPGFAALGWKPQWLVVMPHRGAPDREGSTEVREVDHETLRPLWTEGIRSEPFGQDDEVVRQLLEHRAVSEQAVPTRYFAALVDGRVASFCELFSADGVGQIEGVLTLPERRGRGLARSVVLKALEESRAGSNELTFLVAEEDDWPKELYAKLGFETAGRYAQFLRESV
ncbi:MAG: GNAT family N-acetyltransferase [Actinomycetota bacterium]|nr:GNAT family N-acetyltransferase [Actinomycetota bacterium]